MALSIEEYQTGTAKTAFPYEKAAEQFSGSQETLRYLRVAYCTLKLNGESGEFAEHVGKAFRDDAGYFTPERLTEMRKEIGDIQWYVSQICNELGWSMETILQENLDKLQSRKERGVLQGSGDNR